MAGVLPQRRGYSVRQIFDQIEGAPERNQEQRFQRNLCESREIFPFKTAYFFNEATRWNLTYSRVVKRSSVANM